MSLNMSMVIISNIIITRVSGQVQYADSSISTLVHHKQETTM